MKVLTEDEAAKIILLGAYNDCNKESQALQFSSLDQSYQSIVHQINFHGLLPIICILAFILGIALNYLSPTGKIHVIYNPILLLVLWNFFVYAVLIYRVLKSLFSLPKKNDSTQKTLGACDKVGSQKTKSFLFKLYNILKTNRILIKLKMRDKINADVYKHFHEKWYKVAHPLVHARLLRLLNSGSIALTSGAIVGIYLRGLVVEYNVVWTSTFIRNEASISTLINIIWGPAIYFYSFLTGHNIISELNIGGLISPNGVPAAPWIHLFVITAMTFIIFPRFALATLETIKIGKLKNNFCLPAGYQPEENVEDKRVFKIHDAVGELTDYFKLGIEERRLLFSLEYYLACSDKESEQDSQLRKKKDRWIRDCYDSINVAIVTEKTELFRGLEEIKQQKLSLLKLGTILLETAIFTPYFPITRHQNEKDKLKYDAENGKSEIKNICYKLGYSEHLVKEAVDCYREALKDIPPSNLPKIATIALVSSFLLAVTSGFAAPAIGSAIGGFMGLSGVAAVNAGLALLGGGAIAAGGFGMAGGTVVLIGGGSILGAGVSSGLMSLFSRSHHLVLSELAKMEAVSKVFLKTLPNAYDALNIVIQKEQEMKNGMEAEISKLKLKSNSSKDKIKELEIGIKHCEKAINRLKDFKNEQ